MDENEFKYRTKNLALRTINMIESLPNKPTANIISKQLLRSATSVGANYRAACRARSTADLISKLSIVEEEADESLYWLELLEEAKLIKAAKISKLKSDMNEVVSMIVTSIKTLRARQLQIQNPKSKI